MGLPIEVVEKPTSRPNVVRYELNRSLTGMGHERYVPGQEILGERPADELARRLLERGGVRAVHVYSNEVTVELESGTSADGLLEIMRDLYVYYRPGVEPAKF